MIEFQGGGVENEDVEIYTEKKGLLLIFIRCGVEDYKEKGMNLTLWDQLSTS